MTSANGSNPWALGIVGSPRRGGNTEILVDEVLAGAQEAGALAEKFILNELEIAPCQACDACGQAGECVERDDMHMLIDKMRRSQVWVLGTPIYWWGPTAQFKTFIDRWYGWYSNERQVFEGRHVILTIPLGGSEGYARHTVGMLRDIIPYLSMKPVATVLAPGTHRRGAVINQTTLLLEARQAGREAIKRLD